MSYKRIGNVSNRFQGPSKKVLCVCHGGLLRSPTTAWVLSNEPYNYNTRSCGISDYALIFLDTTLLSWADEVVVMEKDMMEIVREKLKSCLFKNILIQNLEIEDRFEFRDKELIELIKQKYLVV